MQDNLFEAEAKELLNGLLLEPETIVWENIEIALRKEKKRRGLIWFFLFGFIFLGGLLYMPWDREATGISRTIISKKSENELNKAKKNIAQDSVISFSSDKMYKGVCFVKQFKNHEEQVNDIESFNVIAKKEPELLIPVYVKVQPSIYNQTVLPVSQKENLFPKVDTTPNAVADTPVAVKRKWVLSLRASAGVSSINNGILNNANQAFFNAIPSSIQLGAGAGMGAGSGGSGTLQFKPGLYTTFSMDAERKLNKRFGLLVGSQLGILNTGMKLSNQTTYTNETGQWIAAYGGGYVDLIQKNTYALRWRTAIGAGYIFGSSTYRSNQQFLLGGVDLLLGKEKKWRLGAEINYHFSPAMTETIDKINLSRFGVSGSYRLSKK